jgi:hypothetical protein
MNDARKALEDAIRREMPEGKAADVLALVGPLVDAVRRDQAVRDADVMQKMSDRSPNTTPPRGGTNGRQVFSSAARMLDPDVDGWGLNLPDHLKDA